MTTEINNIEVIVQVTNRFGVQTYSHPEVGLHNPDYGYYQKTLPTPFVLNEDNARKALDLANYYIMRIWGVSLYSYEDKWLTYDELISAVGGSNNFKGTGNYKNAWVIEEWDDTGDDGHTEWNHQSNWLVWFPHVTTHNYLSDTDGLTMQCDLSNAIMDFKNNPSKWDNYEALK